MVIPQMNLSSGYYYTGGLRFRLWFTILPTTALAGATLWKPGKNLRLNLLMREK